MSRVELPVARLVNTASSGANWLSAGSDSVAFDASNGDPWFESVQLSSSGFYMCSMSFHITSGAPGELTFCNIVSGENVFTPGFVGKFSSGGLVSFNEEVSDFITFGIISDTEISGQVSFSYYNVGF